ncbi:putative NAD dependent epimerase/dehydratase [Rhexocercosporidium sp. MPI-PUGE-AT-0058]|nr:putative NAD dependent epimerase/dehydratase [Rhexocercosporidium sp. MPI-PUGE-AT-0058]
MRFFITGATGYVGGAVTEQAIAQGHTVHGLSRNEAGDAKLKALGAIPVRGDLTSVDVLRKEAAEADAVCHLAYIHDFTRNYDEILAIDAAVMDALAEPLRGTDKALVTTSGTLVVEPDPEGGETDENAPPLKNPIVDRYSSESYALSKAKEGVRVSAIRLTPYVHGRGASGFIPMLMDNAAKSGEAVYIDDGATHTSGVNVDDAAAMYLLAVEKSKPGDVWNCCETKSVSIKDLAGVVGEVMKVPTKSITREEATERGGHLLALILTLANRPSNKKAMRELGWEPKHLDILEDVRAGSYSVLAEKLLKGESEVKHY